MVGLVDADGLFSEIEIVLGQRQHLPFAHTSPIQHLKSMIGNGIAQQRFGKALVLFRGPNLHFLGLGAFDVAGDTGRIVLEIVKFHGMVEDGAQPHVHGLHVGGGVRLPGLRVTISQQLVLPLHHIAGHDVAHALCGKVWQQLGVYNVAFGFPGAFLQAGKQISLIEFDELRHGHLHVPSLEDEKLPFPLHSIPAGFKSAFGGVDRIPPPILVAVLHQPGAPLLITVDRH